MPRTRTPRSPGAANAAKVAAVPAVDPVLVAHKAFHDPEMPLGDKLRAFEKALPHARTHHADFMRSFSMLLLQASGAHDEASLSLMEQAVSLSPLDSGLHAELGAAYSHVSRYEDCLACFNEALRLNPNQSMARWNRALELLARGDFEEGWRDYEYGRVIQVRPTRSPFPEWDGKPLGNKTLYIWCEQGLGDTMMMLRFVRDARRAAGPFANIIVEVQNTLLPIFSSITGANRVVAMHPSAAFLCPEKDPAHCSLMSLPRILALKSEDMWEPAREYPYPQGFYNRSADRTKDTGPLRVGLVWRGSKAHVNDIRRSLIGAQDFRPIIDSFDAKECEFVSLQQEETPDDLTVPMERHELTTFMETWQCIQTLDLVVGVDTSVCHLSGAMAMPTLLLLPTAVDWRWGRGTDRTYWYPRHRLIRQTQIGDWSLPLTIAQTTIAAMVAAKATEQSAAVAPGKESEI